MINKEVGEENNIHECTLPSVLNPGDGIGTYGTTKVIQFQNRTNTEILVQRVNINDNNNIFTLDPDDIIPGGAEATRFSLGSETADGPSSLKNFKLLYGNVSQGPSGGYKPLVWGVSSRFPNGVWRASNSPDPVGTWPLVTLGTGTEGDLHPHRPTGDYSGGEGHWQNIVRHVVTKDGQLTLNGYIRDRAPGGYGCGVRGFFMHVKRGSYDTSKWPGETTYTGAYPNTVNWEFVSGVGYTKSWNGIQCNLLSNWRPEKAIFTGLGGRPGTKGLTHNSGACDFNGEVSRYFPDMSKRHSAMIAGNSDRNTVKVTWVRSPSNVLSGGQMNSSSLRARYIRFFPLMIHSHATCRIGAWNEKDKWDLGHRATYKANQWWNDASDHSPTYAKLNDTRAHSNWSAKHPWTPGNQWLEMDFGAVKDVDAIGTQGRHNSDQWVSEFLVMSSVDGVNYKIVHENRGPEFTPDEFEKTVNVKKGDFIDMVVDAGYVSSNYDSTRVKFDITHTVPGQGKNGDQYVDKDGYIRDITTHEVSGVELDNGEKMNLTVNCNGTPPGHVKPKNHTDKTYTASLDVDYRCDRLLESGVEFFAKVDTTKVDIIALGAPGWYTVKSKVTSRSITMYVPADTLAGSQTRRWCYSADYGWIWWEPKENLFGSFSGTWMYQSTTAAGNAGAKGWIWFQIENLPSLYSGQQKKWFFAGKLPGDAVGRPVSMSASGNSNPTKELTYKYEVYNKFGEAGWVKEKEMTHKSTSSTAVSLNDPEIYSKIPPSHSSVGFTPANGGTNNQWWGSRNVPQAHPSSLTRAAAYRNSGSQTCPLRLNAMAQIKGIPSRISVMLRSGSNGGNWVTLYRFDQHFTRVNYRPRFMSTDGRYIMHYEGNGWQLNADGKKFTYKNTNLSSVWRKFPPDGSFFYSHTNNKVKPCGKWICNNRINDEMMMFVVWGTRELNVIPVNGRQTTNINIDTIQLRPDIRSHTPSQYTTLSYKLGGITDSKGQVSTNSRIFKITINSTPAGNVNGTTEVVLVREISGTLEMPKPEGSVTGNYLRKDGRFKGSIIYPGMGNTPFTQTSDSWMGIAPVPVIGIRATLPEKTNGTPKGFAITGARVPASGQFYMDCGYDTKQTFVVKTSGGTQIETIGNLGVYYNNGDQADESIAFIGTTISGGTGRAVGTISGSTMSAGDYNITQYLHGDPDNYNIYGSNGTQTLSIGTHAAGHPGASAFYQGFKNAKVEYGGSSSRGTYRKQELCCGRVSSPPNTIDGDNCVDFKQRVLTANGCPTGICLKTPRAGSCEIINVRHFTNGGNLPFQSGSGTWSGSNGVINNWGSGGPTWHKFTNSHPFSDVIIKIEANVSCCSDDVTGVTLGVTSNRNGVIFDPLSKNDGYIHNTGEWGSYPGKTGWWPYHFPGGVTGWGNIVDNQSPWIGGVWNFLGNRDGGHVIDIHSGTPVSGKARTKDFGYWTVRKGETMNWNLFGALNMRNHGGCCQYEGVVVNWMKMTIVRWPQDS